jgi:hypothetical protein
MTRREFVPLAASLAVSAITAQSNADLEIEGKGWRAAFDTTGRISSFKSGQTELVKSRNAHVQTRILFPGETAYVFDQPAKVSRLGNALSFEYRFTGPHPLLVRLEYELIEPVSNAVALKQSVFIQAAQPIRKRVMIQLPRAVQLPEDDRRVFLPLKNGVGRVKRVHGLDNEDDYVYEMAGARYIGRPQLLAFPMVHEFSGRTKLALTHVADPFFTSLLRLPFGNEVGQYQWIYPESLGLPAGVEQRSFYTIVHSGGPDEAINLFYRTALAEVKPGPEWLHDISLVDYDYLSKNGAGWFSDIRRLERLISPADRGKVLLVLHGWYGLLGEYAYDAKKQRLANTWTAFPAARSPNVQALGQGPSDGEPRPMLLTPGYRWNRQSVHAMQPVPFSLDEMHRRIRFAKDRGFRVMLYFADGLDSCDSLSDYTPERVLIRGGWEGPDTRGATYVQNPLHPDVRAFFGGYVRALLAEYGRDIDGLVWDETNTIPGDSAGSDLLPGYAGRAMMTLVKEISAAVSEHPHLALLTSDNIGNFNEVRNAPYSLMAHGTYQDSHCRPEAWPYGLLPNYRNVLWSCNWAPVTNFEFMKFGVEIFDAPVSIGNGAFGDDIGIGDMNETQVERVMRLFEMRTRRKMQIRWIEEGGTGARYGNRILENPYNIL